MKKLSILASVLIVAIFGLATMSWAQEASVFDVVEKLIIRAFTTCTGNCTNADPTYSAYLDVRDSDGIRITPNLLVVTNLSTGNPVQAGADGTYKIHDNDLTNPNFSITFDNETGITYLFCTDIDGLHVMKFSVNPLWPVYGDCGLSNGEAFTSTPNTNLCTAGAPTTPTGSGPWYWSCTGSNGGSTASCSANIRINGVCGSSNGGTFTSAPTTNLCTAGAPTTPTGSGPWYWSCTGSNGGSTASCSANIQSSSLSDLIVSSISSPTSLDNNSPFSISVTVRNQGTGSAEPFTVTVYVSQSYLPGGTVFLTWDVGGLAAGQSISKTFSNIVVNGLATHMNYYFVVKADSGNIITETNETNNVKYRYFTVAR